MLSRLEARFIRLFQSIFYFIVSISHLLILLIFCRVSIEGKNNIPKKGRFILAANHQNFYDGFFLAYACGLFSRKVSFVIARRALKTRFLQLLAMLIGSVVIGNGQEEYQKALKKLNRILSHGGPVGIFPEGEVSKHEIPKKFKGGVAKISIDSKTKVIPVYLCGTYNLRYPKYLLTRPHILLKIGKPIELYNYASVCGNNLDQIAEILRRRIIDLSELSKDKRADTTNKYNAMSFTAMYSKSLEEDLTEVQEGKLSIAK